MELTILLFLDMKDFCTWIARIYFYALQLGKMEKYLCLEEPKSDVIPDGDVET